MIISDTFGGRHLPTVLDPQAMADDVLARWAASREPDAILELFRRVSGQRGMRANPYHDTHSGQFTHGPGGGGWTHQTATDIEAENVVFWEKEVGRKLTASELDDMRAGGYISAGDVRQRVKKGKINIDVRADGVSREALEKLTVQIDRLQGTYPIKADGSRVLQLNIRDPKDMPGNVAGETVHGRGFMNLSSHAVMSDSPTWKTSDKMSVAKTVDQQTYVLTHEWGHATDDDRAPLLFFKHFGALSTYGVESAGEARAEAFAEWVLTRGTTTNPAARDYAKELGWGVIPE